MSDFKWRHFNGTVILHCVRWYCKYGISYRDLEEMMEERGVEVDHSTLYRWVQHYAPELENRLKWYKRSRSYSWRVDETYIKVKGHWKYLYRAIDKGGDTIDFCLSATRNTSAAKRFLKKTIKNNNRQVPLFISSDKAPAYGEAIRKLKAEGILPKGLIHRQIKFLNNRLEGDHGKLKRLIKPSLGFKSMKTAYATIKGFEVMRMFKKGQFNLWLHGETGPIAEAKFINRLFDIVI
ncbi:MAG: IS6 family transposase [Sulfitobacter sp.]|nr:IS6 family transposase [Sneathiella sp.]PHR10143.1 MAG: IS6 family transposase [Sulfitobacter sp.]